MDIGNNFDCFVLVENSCVVDVHVLRLFNKKIVALSTLLFSRRRDGSREMSASFPHKWLMYWNFLVFIIIKDSLVNFNASKLFHVCDTVYP